MNAIHFQFSFDDYIHALRLHARSDAWRRCSHLAFGFVFPAVGAVLFVLGLISLRDGFDGGTIIMVGFGLLLMSFPLLVRLHWKSSFKRTSSDDGQWTLAFSEDLIHCSTSNARSEVQWAAIRSMAEDKNMFLLYLAPAKFLPIPKRACTPEEINELRALFQRRVRPVGN